MVFIILKNFEYMSFEDIYNSHIIDREKVIEKKFNSILEKFKSKLISQRQAIYQLKTCRIFQEVIKRTSFLDQYNPSENERIYYILNDLHEIVKCKYCGNKASFINPKDGYRDICSSKECRSKQLSDVQQGSTKISSNRESKFMEWQNSISRISQLNDKEIKKHLVYQKFLPLTTNQIILDYLKNRCPDSESIEETLDRILKGHPEEKPKCPICGKSVPWVGRKRGLYSKYCSPKCASNDLDVMNRRHETDRKNHGGQLSWVLSNSNPEKIEKRKKTYLEKYGSLNPYDVPSVKAKIEATSMKNWGYPYPMQNPEYAEKIFKKIIENHTDGWWTSKEEKRWRDQLKEVYQDLIWQYMDEKRRFVNPSSNRRFICDFYIPSKDLFIEYQGYYTHHFHPFNEKSEEDQEELKRLREDAKRIDERNKEHGWERNIYKSTIDIWTLTDPLKRRIAAVKHLNYLEIWTTDSFEDVVKKIDSFKDVIS